MCARPWRRRCQQRPGRCVQRPTCWAGYRSQMVEMRGGLYKDTRRGEGVAVVEETDGWSFHVDARGWNTGDIEVGEAPYISQTSCACRAPVSLDALMSPRESESRTAGRSNPLRARLRPSSAPTTTNHSESANSRSNFFEARRRQHQSSSATHKTQHG